MRELYYVITCVLAINVIGRFLYFSVSEEFTTNFIVLIGLVILSLILAITITFRSKQQINGQDFRGLFYLQLAIVFGGHIIKELFWVAVNQDKNFVFLLIMTILLIIGIYNCIRRAKNFKDTCNIRNIKRDNEEIDLYYEYLLQGIKPVLVMYCLVFLSFV